MLCSCNLALATGTRSFFNQGNFHRSTLAGTGQPGPPARGQSAARNTLPTFTGLSIDDCMNQPWHHIVSRRDLPIVILSHNQLTDLCQLLAWLRDTDHQQVIILDNASSFEPLLDFLAGCPEEVIRLDVNLGHTAPWESGLTNRFHGPFAVSDPDVLPDAGCPADAVERFQELLLRHPTFDKAGFGLLLDDIPENYPHRSTVLRWEAPYWERTVEPGVFMAHIDTTFCVHRPGTPYKVTEALRTGFPYVARHLPWYRNPAALDEETRHFFEHRRPDIGYWNRSELPPAARNRQRPA